VQEEKATPMADSPDSQEHDAELGTGANPSLEPVTPIPRWVKMFAIIGLALLILVVTFHLTGNGLGPGMHGMPRGGSTTGARP
jgi:hypothetical protein